MVKLASQPGASVARIAREHDINDNLLFKWLRLWQNEGRISRRLPVTTSSDTGVELLPVEITSDEPKQVPAPTYLRAEAMKGQRCGSARTYVNATIFNRYLPFSCPLKYFRY